MTERILTLPIKDPVSFYGVSDANLERIKSMFTDLIIVARGTELKLKGDEGRLDIFERKLRQLIDYYNRFGSLDDQQVQLVMEKSEDQHAQISKDDSSDIIVYGNNGLVVKARTPNQKKIVLSSREHDMIFAIGPAGTGKTYTAVALAVRALKNKEVRRIILTRPAVEAGENLGFLPGDLKEKLDPYLQPLYDALRDMLPAEKLAQYMETGIIQIAPLAFMRGRTLDNAFVILDEAQNATESQLKMFLTRMGRSAKFVITGDLTQIDLPPKQPSGLKQAVKYLINIEGIDFIHLDEKDVIRHRLVTRIIHAYKQNSSSE
ncbi:MAG: PhoH family protein [Flavobacteriales bacterium]